MKKVILNINILLVLVTLASLLSRTVNPNDFWPVATLGLLFPYLVISNLLFILMWVFYKIPYSLVSIVTLAISWNALGGFFQVNFKDSKLRPGRIEVMSYNLSHGTQIHNSDSDKTESDSRKLIQYFKSLEVTPDVMCFQEVRPFIKEILDKSFEDHQVHQIENRGTAIYSIYPIIKSGEIDFGTTVNSCMWADLMVFNDTIRVYSVHLQSNQITSETAKIVKEGSIQDEKTWNSIGWILSKYKNNNQTRSNQVQRIKEHIITSPYPVILGADLNDPPQSFTYHQLCEVLTDSFRKKGRGLGTTFGGQIPMLRIDFIMTSDRFEVLKHQVDRIPFSDHYPVISSMILQ